MSYFEHTNFNNTCLLLPYFSKLCHSATDHAVSSVSTVFCFSFSEDISVMLFKSWLFPLPPYNLRAAPPGRDQCNV